MVEKHPPDVIRFLQRIAPPRKVAFYVVTQPGDFEGNQLMTFNRYISDGEITQKPNFTKVVNPEFVNDEYEHGDVFNADFRYYISEGYRELQITPEDVASALIKRETSITTVYLNECGNVFRKLQNPIIRSLSEIKIERVNLIQWSTEIYQYLEDQILTGPNSNPSLNEIRERFYLNMKSSNAIHDPMLSVYIEQMLVLGRLPLMSELDDVFASLYKGKQKKDWPKLTLAPLCDPEDTSFS